MKHIKLVGIAAAMALALVALVGAASAQASIQVESCEGESNCQPATAATFECEGEECWQMTEGTTFVLEGLITGKTGTGLPWINCEFSLEGEVTDGRSESGSDPVELVVNNSEDPCGWQAENLPWQITTNAEAYPEMRVSGFETTLQNGFGKCHYFEDESHILTLEGIGVREPSRIGGWLDTTLLNFPCHDGELRMSGNLYEMSVSDPNNPSADGLIITEE